jgi:hypothetical protein
MTTVPKHIYWSCREQPSVDMRDPAQKKWFLEQTLAHGTMADIRALNLVDVEEALPFLRLPRHVRALWGDYFDRRNTNTVPPEDS